MFFFSSVIATISRKEHRDTSAPPFIWLHVSNLHIHTVGMSQQQSTGYKTAFTINLQALHLFHQIFQTLSIIYRHFIPSILQYHTAECRTHTEHSHASLRTCDCGLSGTVYATLMPSASCGALKSSASSAVSSTRQIPETRKKFLSRVKDLINIPLSVSEVCSSWLV